MPIVNLCIACTLGFIAAHGMELVAIHHYGTPIPSAAGVAGITFAGTTLLVFSVLQIFGSDRR